jgi:hypothetical protein
MTTTETHFDIAGPHGGAWFEAKIQYDYYWDGESGGVSVSRMWFRHPAVKGKPEFEWQENPLLEQLLDTEDLCLSLLEEYEGAARSYAEAAE